MTRLWSGPRFSRSAAAPHARGQRPTRKPAHTRQSRLRLERLEDRTTPSTSIPLNNVSWTPLGPAPINSGTAPGTLTSSGRVTAIAADPTNANIIYVGAASGGVWKTTNGGTSWTPLTDGQASLATGSLALDPLNSNIIYAGTGEENFSADSYYGCGILKSVDGGATWTTLGSSIWDTSTGGA